MPLAHAHKPGQSLGCINHANGCDDEVAHCQQCSLVLIRADGSHVWRPVAEVVMRRTHTVPASLI